jgi:Uma2 family endonuclease
MSTSPQLTPHEPEYAWELATLYPEQGEWSEDGYLDLTDGTNRRIEFTDGRLEFLPMPTEIHQELLEFLFAMLQQFVRAGDLGKVHTSGIRIRIRPRKIRQPDIVFLRRDHYHARHNRVWDGADLVMEIVSDDPKDRQRDYEQKLIDYAEAKIAEYWIVDFERKTVVVHQLREGGYVAHGEFRRGAAARSALLDGFSVDVDALFAAAEDVPE